MRNLGLSLMLSLVLLAGVPCLAHADTSPSVDSGLPSFTDSMLKMFQAAKDTYCIEYTSEDTPLSIPDEAQTSSSIEIADDFTITDVNVTLTITHPLAHDLTIWVVSPQGSRAFLAVQAGDTGANFTDTTFDDSASTDIANGNEPFSNSYIPETALSVFDDENALGTWTLYVMDSESGNTGVLQSWTLSFNNTCSNTNEGNTTSLTGIWEWVGIVLAVLVPLGVIQFIGGGVGGSGGFDPCFIATAAYGTPLAHQIDVLRALRDTVLLNNSLGTAFVDLYYRLSPPVAECIAQHPWAAACVRILLIPVIGVSHLALAAPQVLLFAFLALSARLLWRKRHAARGR